MEKICRIGTIESFKAFDENRATIGGVSIVRPPPDYGNGENFSRLNARKTHIDTLFLLLCDTENFRIKSIPLHIVKSCNTNNKGGKNSIGQGSSLSKSGRKGLGSSFGQETEEGSSEKLYVGHLRVLTETAGWPCNAAIYYNFNSGSHKHNNLSTPNSTRIYVLETVASDKSENDVNLCISIYQIRGVLNFELPIYCKRSNFSEIEANFAQAVEDFFKKYQSDSMGSNFDYDFMEIEDDSGATDSSSTTGSVTGIPPYGTLKYAIRHVDRTNILIFEGDGAWFGNVFAVSPNENKSTQINEFCNSEFVAPHQLNKLDRIFINAFGFENLFEIRPQQTGRRASLTQVHTQVQTMKREMSMSQIPQDIPIEIISCGPVVKLQKPHELEIAAVDCSACGELMAVLLSDYSV